VQEGLACVEITDRAIAAGAPIHFDMHTRTFGIASITAIMPATLAALPGDALRAAFASGEAERVIRAGKSMFTEARWDAITLLGETVPDNLAKRSMTEVAAALGTDPVGAVIRLIGENPDHAGGIYLLRHLYAEDDLLQAFRHSHCMPGSDATTLTPQGRQACRFFHGAFTWAAWYVRTMWRDRKVFTLEETIRRVTALPAAIIGLADRGMLRPGLAADINVFDPKTINCEMPKIEADLPAAAKRITQRAKGFLATVVGGQVFMRNGEHTGALPGRLIRGPLYAKT